MHAVALVIVMSVVFLSVGTPVESTCPSTKQEPKAIDTKFLRDFAITRGFMLGRPAKPKPTPDGKAVLFLRSPARSPDMHLYEFEVETKKTRTLLTPEQVLKGAEEKLTPEEKARRERMRETARGFTSFQLSEDGESLLVSLSGKLYLVRRKDGDVRELPTGKGTLLDPKFALNGKQVAYVLDHDVYVMDLEKLKETKVTAGGTADVSHGLAEFVAQEEMDRYSGYWWSPDSKWIAYEEADARDVEIWRAADPAKPGDEAHPQRYPRPGKNNVKVRLGIVSTAGGETTWVDWDREKYPYLATVKWDKGGPLTIVVQTRSQQEMLVLAVDSKTGKTTELLKETDDAWVNLDQDVPKWLEDGSGFLWTSERAGGPQLELRDVNGKLVRVLVGPEAGYADLLHFDDKAGQVDFGAGTDPTQTHLYRVSLDGGKLTKLSEVAGLHSAVFAKNHSRYVKRSTGPKSMPQSTVHDVDGNLIAELPSVAEPPPFVPQTEFVQVKIPVEKIKTVTDAATGRMLRIKLIEEEPFYCSVTRPRDFDPKKRYPVILDVYGGPHHQHVLQSMGHRLLAQWYADQDFIVAAIDGRGTPRRGRAWERSIRGSFGTIPLDDQVAGLQALGKKYPELDLGRVGIKGWSFGGYMAALAVLRRPDIFKAAVAGAPVTDWEDYDTHYTERYLGLLDENKQGYKESNLLTYAADLKRPLLLIHGTSDDNVFFVHTLKLSDALFKHGKEHDVLPLSGFTHMVPDPLVKERLEERIVRFFQKHL